MKFSGIIALVMTLVCTPALAQVTPGTSPLSIPKGGTGGSSWTTNNPVIGNGTGPLQQGTLTGNTTKFVTSTGGLTSGDCVKIDASGNYIDAGAQCGSGSNTPQNQVFAAPGAVTTLTLTNTPLPTTALFLSIYFDGVFQVHSTWSFNSGTGVITFNSAIPASVQEVEAIWSAPQSTSFENTNVSSVGDANYSIQTADRTIITSANFTATRVWTLPAISSLQPGQHFSIRDVFGGINNPSNSSIVGLEIVPSGSDHINAGLVSGGITAYYNCRRYTSLELTEDGSHNWIISAAYNTDTLIGVDLTGADCTGNSDSTIAFNNAIAAAKTGADWATILAVGVHVGPGAYCVSTINGTGLAGFIFRAEHYSSIIYGSQQSGTSYPVLDFTGAADLTVDGAIVYGQVCKGGGAPSTPPSTALFIGDQGSGNIANLVHIKGFGAQGSFGGATCVVYATPQVSFAEQSNCVQVAAAPALYVGSTNDLGIVSKYATVCSSGCGPANDVTFAESWVVQQGASCAGQPLIEIHSAQLRMRGGSDQIYNSTCGYFVLGKGANHGVIFDGVQWVGPATNFIALNSSGDSINGLWVNGSDFLSASITNRTNGLGTITNQAWCGNAEPSSPTVPVNNCSTTTFY